MKTNLRHMFIEFHMLRPSYSWKSKYVTQEGFEMTLKKTLLAALCLVGFLVSASSGFAMPFFSEATSKQAVILSPLEKWMPTWDLESYILLIEHAGYRVDVLLNENASIAFLKTGLADYDLVVLRTDAFIREGLTFYCAGDTADLQAREKFGGEISSNEVEVAACVGFSVLFLGHYYTAGTLKHGLVYVLASESAELSSSFTSAGAAAFIGYYSAHSIQWGRLDAYSIQLLYYMSEGSSVADAVIQLYVYLNTGHGKTADWVTPYWSGDGTYTI